MSEETADPIDIEADVETIEGEEDQERWVPTKENRGLHGAIPEDEVLDWYSPERAAAKERIRIAFVTGKATLAYMSRVEKVPYGTIAQWSVNEKWGEAKAAVAEQTSNSLVENLSDFIAKERAVQVKRAISRANKLRSLVDKAAENAEGSENGLLPSDVQALSTAEERADNITRRNLGMDQQSGGGSSLSVNILSQSIHLS